MVDDWEEREASLNCQTFPPFLMKHHELYQFLR
nr:MAG TPA: hypothetical protein [Microviridae sp.]